MGPGAVSNQISIHRRRTTMPPKPDATPGDISWFVQDRFGLFIHWGLYALLARHEWVKQKEEIPDSRYDIYFEHFDPDLYDPTIWAKAAKNAGMKYFVITSKHHEGFCLWDSALTDYKVTNTPCGKDLLVPMVDAFRHEGLKIGFYHSLLDWHHPDFPIDGLHSQRNDKELREKEKNRDVTKYADYLCGQSAELMDRFSPDIMWYDFSYSAFMEDGGKGKDDWQSERVIEMLRKKNPNILINDRLEIDQDFKTPEQVQPDKWHEVDGKPVYWEACQTLNGSWGYDRDNMDWKSVGMLLRMLIDGVSKGGNLLLNVGPTGRGEFDDRALSTLEGIGEWMKRHSRAIYGCTASDFTPPSDCRYTQNGNRLYLHIMTWPMKHLRLKGLADKVKYAQLLNDASEVFIRTDVHGESADSGELILEFPIQAPNVEIPVVELFLKD
jgi:alpha-L-fucosidase